MSIIPKINLSFGNTLNNISITNPKAANATTALFIFSQLLGIIFTFLVALGLLTPPTSWQWIPLGVVLFGTLTIPLVTLKGIREAVYWILVALNIVSYVYVFDVKLVRNALLVFVVLFVAFAIVEFPRRLNL